MDIYGIIGYPAKHSRSPSIHNAAFKHLKIDAEYKIFEVAPENLEKFLKEEMPAKGIKGLSVTIPHKIECMKFLDEIKTTAKDLGAVNTIKYENGKLIGENFDWVGVYKPLKEITEIENKHIVICGAGGAARAAAYAITRENPSSLTVLVRNPSADSHPGGNLSTEKILPKYQDFAKTFNCRVDSLTNLKNYEADIIINATQVGMTSQSDPSAINQTLIPQDYLKPHMTVFEVVYAPLETKLILDAKQAGCKTVTGEKMLLSQALEQFEFWTNQIAPKSVMLQALLRNL
ncbi:shikimate dehydrogenase [Patescibacteria group bacterium]|nr:shikimate dehydrogenase [Patescibacteria group bacterium]